MDKKWTDEAVELDHNDQLNLQSYLLIYAVYVAGTSHNDSSSVSLTILDNIPL